MNIKNIEFKAKVDNIEDYENQLLKLNPVFKGIDHQMDTYFNVTGFCACLTIHLKPEFLLDST